MSFLCPDIITESLLREGLDYLKTNPALLDNIFKSLTFTYASTKYGQAEIEKIKDWVQNGNIAIVHSFYEAEAKSPCISIQLGTDVEDQRLAHLDDFEEDSIVPITDPDELEALEIVSNVISIDYDKPNGIIYIDDSIDLSGVYSNLIFEDADANEFTIIGGIINTPGSKQIMVSPNSEVNISELGTIKSSIDYRQYEVRGVVSNVTLMLGAHTKDALKTKYLYLLIKYMILSRKKDLINRNFVVSSFQGSDFTKNLQYQGDQVYTRFLTLTGKIEENWSSDEVIPIEGIDIVVKVPKDVATTEDLEKTDQTIQIQD